MREWVVLAETDLLDGLTHSMVEHVTIIYVLNYYLIGTRVVPNLAIIAIVPLYAYPLYKRLAVLITTTLLFSN
jgi:hypothetical protein